MLKDALKTLPNTNNLLIHYCNDNNSYIERDYQLLLRIVFPQYS